MAGTLTPPRETNQQQLSSTKDWLEVIIIALYGLILALMKFQSIILLAALGCLVAMPACQKKEYSPVQVIAPDEPIVVVPDSVYKGPLIITKGGKYTGNYKSSDSKVPAISIYTSEPVELTGCLVAG